MFPHSECFRIHDKPLSFSSPWLPSYLKRTAGATTNAHDGLTYRLPGMKIKEAQRTKEWHPLLRECMGAAGVAGVSIALADTSACLHAGRVMALHQNRSPVMSGTSDTEHFILAPLF